MLASINTLNLVVTINTILFDIPKLCILLTECLCIFRTVLTKKQDFFLKKALTGSLL
jgi:hypothetical protein